MSGSFDLKGVIAVQMVNFAELPIGTILDFVSVERQHFSVRIIGGVDLSRGGGRSVSVLEAPHRYSNKTLLFWVLAGTRLNSLDTMYRMALSFRKDGLLVFGPGDTVVIVDDMGAIASGRMFHTFEIRSVAVR